MTIHAALRELGLTLPDISAPEGLYSPYLIYDNMLYVSGQLPFDEDGNLICGVVGKSIDVQSARKAAERAALSALAQVQAALGGSFDRLDRLFRMTGYVNSSPDFMQHPAVVDGASALFNTLFAAHKHVRCAIGCNSLPKGVAVEIETVFLIK